MKLFDVFGEDGSKWNKGGGVSPDGTKVCLTVGLQDICEDISEYDEYYFRLEDIIMQFHNEIHFEWIQKGRDVVTGKGFLPYFNDHNETTWEDMSRVIKVSEL